MMAVLLTAVHCRSLEVCTFSTRRTLPVPSPSLLPAGTPLFLLAAALLNSHLRHAPDG